METFLNKNSTFRVGRSKILLVFCDLSDSFKVLTFGVTMAIFLIDKKRTPNSDKNEILF